MTQAAPTPLEMAEALEKLRMWLVSRELRRSAAGAHEDAARYAAHAVAVVAAAAFIRETLEAVKPAPVRFDRDCCRAEREACANLAQEEEERGWGRKGFHRVADAIRGRGAWISHLDDEVRRLAGGKDEG